MKVYDQGDSFICNDKTETIRYSIKKYTIMGFYEYAANLQWLRILQVHVSIKVISKFGLG